MPSQWLAWLKAAFLVLVPSGLHCASDSPSPAPDIKQTHSKDTASPRCSRRSGGANLLPLENPSGCRTSCSFDQSVCLTEHGARERGSEVSFGTLVCWLACKDYGQKLR
ncbi:unnamed protein product [Effrenium voratum]|uniref:Uncharacterized protein n=1 Tax=Effrenium voratum TaxID=2562239 RepID=A0AA36NIR7_9DINO|nr:unnamed protein product [Effrenium voratum]CAJ1414281.1 unnamed protein product [Effrenium voratum]